MLIMSNIYSRKTLNMEYRDIRYEIITKLHPYHLQSYCEASRAKQQECDDLKYDYLQLWVWPSRSVLEIKQMLPNIDFNDVVELCLFYNPIPESMGKFDEISLFLSACRVGQSDPLIYFKDLLIDVSAVGWICYRYNRLDIIKQLINEYSAIVNGGAETYRNNIILSRLNELRVFHNMILIHNNPKAQIVDIKLIGYMHNFLISGVYLLSRNELLEAVVILSGLASDDKVFNYLTGIDKTFSTVTAEFDDLIINLIALSDTKNIDALLNKYYPDVQIRNPRFQSPKQPGFWSTAGNNLDYHLHPELIDKLDPEKQLIFHLTRGDYGKYMQLRNKGVPMIIESNILLGTNDVGYVSMNREFQGRFNIYIGTEPDLAYLRIDITEPETYIFLDPLDKPYLFM